MSTSLVLDSEAFSSLAHARSPRGRKVVEALEAARRLNRVVVVPAVVLAELYRGPTQDPVIDACLSRETGLRIRDTDRSFARLVGSILASAGAGSEDIVDAHVVAAATEYGGGVILTGDPADLTRLAGVTPAIVVHAV